MKKLILFTLSLLLASTFLPFSQICANALTEGDFEYEISDGGAALKGYRGDSADVTVPDYLGGYPVTSIGDRAFSYCTSLVSIDIPEGVKSIGGSAFNGCSKLESINIPEGVTSIGDLAFNGCSSLESVVIPEGVIYIGRYAFEDNTNLTKVILPESAILLMGDVFTYNSDTILYCVKGSYAEKYATIKGFNVEYIETGDINYDLIIDIKDIIRLKKLTADGTEKFSAADLVQDGEIDNLDLAALRQKLISG